MPFPPRIESIDHLDTLLSEPTPHAIEALNKLDGDIMLLGVAGKMGPTLANMARIASERAGVKRRIVGVARFSEPGVEPWLHARGIETIRCDLLDEAQIAALPDVPNVIAMFGMKFGATGQEARTWAMNCLAPAFVCRRFRRSRIVAFSTGNVYGLTKVEHSLRECVADALAERVLYFGPPESDPLHPTGDYAMSCVGRERIYEYCSRTYGIPMAILRLNYATEMRYGVLVDIAQRVWVCQPVDVSMGYFNAIWQADANAAALSAFAFLETPPRVLNIAGPELLSVRKVGAEFGRRFGKPVAVHGMESSDALLSNAERSHRLFGQPRVDAEQMMAWIADWVMRGGATLGKPTHFEVRDGKF